MSMIIPIFLMLAKMLYHHDKQLLYLDVSLFFETTILHIGSKEWYGVSCVYDVILSTHKGFICFPNEKERKGGKERADNELVEKNIIFCVGLAQFVRSMSHGISSKFDFYCSQSSLMRDL